MKILFKKNVCDKKKFFFMRHECGISNAEGRKFGLIDNVVNLKVFFDEEI